MTTTPTTKEAPKKPRTTTPQPTTKEAPKKPTPVPSGSTPAPRLSKAASSVETARNHGPDKAPQVLLFPTEKERREGITQCRPPPPREDGLQTDWIHQALSLKPGTYKIRFVREKPHWNAVYSGEEMMAIGIEQAYLAEIKQICLGCGQFCPKHGSSSVSLHLNQQNCSLANRLRREVEESNKEGKNIMLCKVAGCNTYHVNTYDEGVGPEIKNHMKTKHKNCTEEEYLQGVEFSNNWEEVHQCAGCNRLFTSVKSSYMHFAHNHHKKGFACMFCYPGEDSARPCTTFETYPQHLAEKLIQHWKEPITCQQAKCGKTLNLKDFILHGKGNKDHIVKAQTYTLSSFARQVPSGDLFTLLRVAYYLPRVTRKRVWTRRLIKIFFHQGKIQSTKNTGMSFNGSLITDSSKRKRKWKRKSWISPME